MKRRDKIAKSELQCVVLNAFRGELSTCGIVTRVRFDPINGIETRHVRRLQPREQGVWLGVEGPEFDWPGHRPMITRERAAFSYRLATLRYPKSIGHRKTSIDFSG